MHSTSTSCTCHKCGALLHQHHGSHHRTVQDLPILEKQVMLDMQIYDYERSSDTCASFAPKKTFDGFLSYNSRMTDRLEDFACVLAVETIQQALIGRSENMTASLLKFLALICMILDHIGEFIPNSPMWFKYLGRLSAPLFFYGSAWGLYYTHNPRMYILRLYILSVIMALGNIAVASFFNPSCELSNNIFQTLFLGCAITYLIDRKNALKDKCFMAVLIMIQQAQTAASSINSGFSISVIYLYFPIISSQQYYKAE